MPTGLTRVVPVVGSQFEKPLNKYLNIPCSRLVGVLLLTSSLVCTAPSKADQFYAGLVDAALERTQHHVRYDGSYRKIAYPMGDVPDAIGVCTDVVIRAYRVMNIDLQRLVHEDMQASFASYPGFWGLSKPDPNIDHRRVPNLQRFFQRNGETLAVSLRATNYRPGDLVTWMLPGNLPHIGIVTHLSAPDTGRPMIVHNIGLGPKLEDMLFDYPITGHYRFRSNR